MAFNPELTQRVVRDCEKECGNLGRVVGQLLAHQPEHRPSAAQVLALLDSQHKATGKLRDAAKELCEEYLCSLCSSLVVDAQSACSEEHIICFLCLQGQCPLPSSCHLVACPPAIIK